MKNLNITVLQYYIYKIVYNINIILKNDLLFDYLYLIFIIKIKNYNNNK